MHIINKSFQLVYSYCFRSGEIPSQQFRLIIFFVFFINPVFLSADFSYSIKKNDTLYSIAGRYNVSVSDIQEKNSITDPSRINENQTIIIPETENKDSFYIVKYGDTLWSIAGSSGISVDKLADYNKIKNTEILLVNRKLIIPASNNSTISANNNLSLPVDIDIPTLPREVKKKAIASCSNEEEFNKLIISALKKNQLFSNVNKENLLPPGFCPPDLTNVSKTLLTDEDSVLLRSVLMRDLTGLINSAKKDDIYLKINSGFRSYSRQKELLEYYTKRDGERKAEIHCAPPGGSEHHLGTAIDFNVVEGKSEDLWLLENAGHYGFVQSYPRDSIQITGYKYEPWHYRYVGEKAAFIINNYFEGIPALFYKWIESEGFALL